MPRIFSKLKPTAVATTVTFLLLFHFNPAIAGDPFRKTDSRAISETTEAAFEEMFIAGDYKQAASILEETGEEVDPLAYALKASIAYTEEEWEGVKTAAEKTLYYAEEIGESDPLRHHLYLAVGHFLEGSYLFQVEGPFSVLKKLQKVFRHLELAEKANSDDPELNLIKGYLDLILAVNLPFFEPEHAIARFENYASPPYLVNRGLAIAYRDLEEYEKAKAAVEKAMEVTPENPELHYLKGQILYKLGEETRSLQLAEQAVKHFDSAIARSERLPNSISHPYERERRLAQELLEEIQTAKR
jgi:tetratricopeptide (TPR) repeat protein